MKCNLAIYIYIMSPLISAPQRYTAVVLLELLHICNSILLQYGRFYCSIFYIIIRQAL